MKTSNSKRKAHAFLGRVALIIATTLALFLAGCNQSGTGTGGGGETPTPSEKKKHKVTFSVEGTPANGTLKAKVGDKETSTSPISDLEEGKTVTFTATPSTGYKVKEWKLNNNVVQNNKENTYTYTVAGNATITVSFESKTPKYTITFNVEGTPANGTLTAKVGETTKTSPISDMEESTVVTFTATPDAGYKVKEWKVDNDVQSNTENTYTYTVGQKDAKITVSFELRANVAILTLGEGKNTIRVKVKTSDNNAIKVEGCNETSLASGIFAQTTLNVKANVTKVVLEGKIIELDCQSSGLTGLNVQSLTALEALTCNTNKITELNVQGLTSLKNISCFDNNLTELNVQGLNNLVILSCGGNKLTTLNVKGLTLLKDFNCRVNQLQNLDVSDLTALKMLDCSENQLATLVLKKCTTLQELYCYGNKLAILNVKDCTALKNLDCAQNKLEATAMTQLLTDLPTRAEGDNARAALYTEETGKEEGNCKVFNTPESLQNAFDGAKAKHWTFTKKTDDDYPEIT